MDWKREAEKIRQAMQEHKRNLETDPEYRKRSEETKKRLEENLPMLRYEEN